MTVLGEAGHSPLAQTGPSRAALVDSQIQWWFIVGVLGHDLPEVSDAHLQATADRFRRDNHLTGAADTHAWLDSNGWNLDDFERIVERLASLSRLRQDVAADQVEQFFEVNRAAFDQAELAEVLVTDEALASSLAEALQAGSATFDELARQHSVVPGADRSAGYLGLVSRGALKPGLAAAVFTGKAGSHVGPIRTDAGWHLLHVFEIVHAELNESTTSLVEEAIFTEWLADQLLARDLAGPAPGSTT